MFSFKDGLFSGYDKDNSRYSNASWRYVLDEEGYPMKADRLEQPGTVFSSCLEILWEELAAIPGVTLYGPEPGEQPRVAVLSFNLKGCEPEDLAGLLQANYQVQLCSGLHCAPLAHRTIGTYPEGTVRISPGYFTQDREIVRFIDAVKQISMIHTDWLVD